MLGESHVFRLRLALEVRFDGLVLLIKLREVWYKIFNNVGVRKRVNPGFMFCIRRDPT